MELELSYDTWYLLAQHLHWVNNGYDTMKIRELIKTFRNENPFKSIKLNQIEDNIGLPINTNFELEELRNLTYFFPYLMKLDYELTFLKYCVNLKEADFRCSNIQDISDVIYLKNLTKIDLSATKINSIDALATLENIEEINLEYCQTVSLVPLLNHKKLKKIVLENVEKEEDLLNVISNQEEILAEYLVENSTVLMGLSFSRYLVCINLEKETLTISMTSVVTDKMGQFCKIPTEMLDDKNFMIAYIELLNTELDKRSQVILKSNYDIVESFKYYTNEEIDFGVKMKIKINTN